MKTYGKINYFRIEREYSIKDSNNIFIKDGEGWSSIGKNQLLPGEDIEDCVKKLFNSIAIFF